MDMTNTTIKLRPFTFDDAQAVVDLINAYAQHLHGWDIAELDEMITDWKSPGINLEETSRVVENSQGEAIGYIDVWDNTKPHVIKHIWGILHPDSWNEALYHQMLAWAEACCRDRNKLAPEGARILMSQGIAHKDNQAITALKSYGFVLVRHFYQMKIELDVRPMAPSLPEGLRIEPIEIDSELEEAIRANEEAFKDHWGHVDRPVDELLEQWKHRIKNNKDFDPTLWFLAKDEDQIAGVCRCSGKTVEDPEMGWVNELSVRKPWRCRTLGMALLLTGFQEFYRRGKQRAGLAVDATNLTNATRLYEKAGMHVTEQFDIFEKELRPGFDLKTK